MLIALRCINTVLRTVPTVRRTMELCNMSGDNSVFYAIYNNKCINRSFHILDSPAHMSNLWYSCIVCWRGNFVLWTDQPSGFRPLFLRHMGLFPDFVFFRVGGELFVPKGAHRPWDHFQFFVKHVGFARHCSQVLVFRDLSRLCFL